MAVSHVYSQTVADGTATSVVRPSDWNSAHNQYLTISGNTAGQSTVSGTNVVFQGGNNVTLSANTAAGAATIVVSAANTVAQTVQTQPSGNIAGAGFTSTTTAGVAVVATQNSNGLSVGVPNYITTAALSNHSHSITVNGTNINYTTGGNSEGVQLSLSVPADGGKAGTGFTSTTTAGTAVVGTLNTNGLSLGVPAYLTAAAGGGGAAIGMSTIGNTSGTTNTYTSGTYVLAGGNNITLSQSGSTLTISAPNGGGAGASNLGNVAGTTGLVSNRLVLAGGNNITISQSTNGESATVSIVGAAGAGGYTVSGFIPFPDPIAGTLAQGNGTIYVHPHILPGAVTFDRIGIYVNYSQATNSTLTVSITQRMGIYTKNGSTLSLLSSYQGTMSVNGSGTASSASNSGPRLATFGMSGSHSGNVWIAVMLSTATAGANASISQFFVSQLNSSVSGMLGAGSAATVGMYPGRGYYSATSSVMPASMAYSHITQNSSVAQRTPIFFLTNGTH